MLRWLALTILLASPASAQYPPFNPAAEYITSGQDEPGYRAWVTRVGWRPSYVKAFNDYLTVHGVGGVAPTWQLLRTATDWQKCAAEPFEVPPVHAWPNIVAALRYVGAFVEPVVGEVEVVSVYRNPALNRCAGGAATSMHLTLGAVDMVPLRPVSREMLMSTLCRIHVASGDWNNIGLGFYKGLRFHINARKFREWGTQGAAGGWGCHAVLAEGAMPFGGAPATPPPVSTEQPAFIFRTVP
ncbi:MAG TPA: D-Ala-D-Ala carboxypeptidase family metallohydrolase, partial [Sphingomicrobium sp.]|nr:D-Ala-D-Ala carboxypeptidase family metallohydrolase [Sphingomicrobium sp.]